MIFNNNIMEYGLIFTCASNIAQHGNGAQMTNLFRIQEYVSLAFHTAHGFVSREDVFRWRMAPKGISGIIDRREMTAWR